MDAQAPDMGADPMGGNASFMPGGDPNAAMDPNAVTDPNAAGEPVMGSDPFGDSGEEMTDDPEKKVESLIGQAASIIRKDMNSDGINKHEDKKKEVLGMLVSAIVDGMDEDERNSIVDYLSDKLNGSGESEGDADDTGENAESIPQEQQPVEDPNAGTDPDAGQPAPQDQIMEDIVNEITNGILNRKGNGGEDVKTASNIKNGQRQGYKAKPFKR